MEKIFIDENINIKTGDEAAKYIKEKNDGQYFNDKKGIAKVDKGRWEKAQKAEHTHWMKLGLQTINDRNIAHYNNYEAYKSIKEKRFSKAIEIGCGPFTNLRLIGSVCKIEKCVLLDPLVDYYLKHPHCPYDNSYLYIESPGITYKASRKYFTRLYRFIRKMVYKKIIIESLFNIPFEEFETNKKYDLVVIINVLEHCYDVEKVFKNINNILNKNGVLIFSDKLMTIEKIQNEVNVIYDAAHPLRINKDFILDYLKNNFIPSYHFINIDSVEVEDGIKAGFNELYFIGIKK